MVKVTTSEWKHLWVQGRRCGQQLCVWQNSEHFPLRFISLYLLNWSSAPPWCWCMSSSTWDTVCGQSPEQELVKIFWLQWEYCWLVFSADKFFAFSSTESPYHPISPPVFPVNANRGRWTHEHTSCVFMQRKLFCSNNTVGHLAVSVYSGR